MSADLIISVKNAREAKVIDKALSPDNQNLPKGMSIKQHSRGKDFTVRILMSKEAQTPLETLISTLDEFVAHTQAVVETLDKVERKTIHDRSKDSKGRSGERKRQPSKAKYARLSLRSTSITR